MTIQVAIRNKQQGVFYYSDSILVDAVVDRQATLQPSAFIPLWRELSDANEAIQTISHSSNVDAILSAVSQAFTLQVPESFSSASANSSYWLSTMLSGRDPQSTLVMRFP